MAAVKREVGSSVRTTCKRSSPHRRAFPIPCSSTLANCRSSRRFFMIRVAVAVQAIAFFSKQCSTASAKCQLLLFEYRIYPTTEQIDPDAMPRAIAIYETGRFGRAARVLSISRRPAAWRCASSQRPNVYPSTDRPSCRRYKMVRTRINAGLSRNTQMEFDLNLLTVAATPTRSADTSPCRRLNDFHLQARARCRASEKRRRS